MLMKDNMPYSMCTYYPFYRFRKISLYNSVCKFILLWGILRQDIRNDYWSLYLWMNIMLRALCKLKTDIRHVICCFGQSLFWGSAPTCIIRQLSDLTGLVYNPRNLPSSKNIFNCEWICLSLIFSDDQFIFSVSYHGKM